MVIKNIIKNILKISFNLFFGMLFFCWSEKNIIKNKKLYIPVVDEKNAKRDI